MQDFVEISLPPPSYDIIITHPYTHKQAQIRSDMEGLMHVVVSLGS